ncbi:MAG TPA: tetratricopeptide repeat protein [Verrucomicrobiae bacterium]|nr:tetratricopeptide repeat protein [Verrucomicrobiae bacterium]
MSRSRFVMLLLALGTLAIYLPVSHYGFSIYDDPDYITDNSHVQDGLTWSGIKWAFTTWQAANWHPLTWLSLMAGCQLFGLNAGIQHDINVLFHTANAILLLALLLRLTSAFWPSVIVAALFAWHPLHVESVAWISERKDVLSTFFALLTLLTYARYADPRLTSALSERGQPADAKSRSKAKRAPAFFRAAALFLFALALMSKPMFVTLPLVMLLLDFWPLGRFNRFGACRPSPHPDPLPSHQNESGEGTAGGPEQMHGGPAVCRSNLENENFQEKTVLRLIFEKWPFFLLSMASCVVTFLSQSHGGAVRSLARVPLGLRLENVPVAYADYLLKLFWPAHLAVFYPLPRTIPAVAVATAVAVLILISAAAWLARKKFPYFPVGWLWFLATLVPVIGLVQVGNAAIADRYAYFPSIGIFLMVALGIRDATKRLHFGNQVAAAGAILVLAVCLALTHRQINFWRDDIALFSHALEVTPDNVTARLNLGLALEKAGRKPEAMDEYRQALKLDPENVEARTNLANLLADDGHFEEALANYQAALRLDPESAVTHDDFGNLLVRMGKYDEAMKQYADAAKLAPTDWHTPYLTGKALLRQGRDAEAIPFLQQALELAPDNSHLLNFFAEVLASDENPGVRNSPLALALAKKANDLSGGIQPDVLQTLAMAEAEAGQFAAAQQTCEDARTVAQALGLTNQVEEIGRQLQLYQDHQPFRQSFTNAATEILPNE